MSFEQIINIKKNMFLRQVRNNIKNEAFKYLLNKIKSIEREFDYGDQLKCQRYLQPNQILTYEEQISIFAYRSRMNNVKYNFGSDEELCVCGY